VPLRLIQRDFSKRIKQINGKIKGRDNLIIIDRSFLKETLLDLFYQRSSFLVLVDLATPGKDSAGNSVSVAEDFDDLFHSSKVL
jgi:hypothetical protein